MGTHRSLAMLRGTSLSGFATLCSLPITDFEDEEDQTDISERPHEISERPEELDSICSAFYSNANQFLEYLWNEDVKQKKESYWMEDQYLRDLILFCLFLLVIQVVRVLYNNGPWPTN